jgi:hypothetical protein
LFALLSGGLMIYYSEIIDNLFSIIICSVLSGITILTYSIFRISKYYVNAQVQKNLWKIIVFLFCYSFLAFTGHINTEVVLLGINAGLFVSVLIALPAFFKLKVVARAGGAIDFGLWSGFFFAMAIMSLMTNADKFLIDTYIGRSQAGHYFFMQNIFLFPLTQIQNYSGFRELAVFKEAFTIQKLNASLKRNTVIAVALSLLLLGGFILAAAFVPGHLTHLTYADTWIVILFLLNGSCRVLYSVVSAAMGAVGDHAMIRNANAWTVAVFLVLIALFAHGSISLVSVSMLFLAFWTARAIIFYLHLTKHEVRNFALD